MALRGPRNATRLWEVRESCTSHVVSHSLARYGEARIAELRTLLHEVLPTTTYGHPTWWLWGDIKFDRTQLC